MPGEGECQKARGAALDAEPTGFPEEGGKTAATAMPAKCGKEAEPSPSRHPLSLQDPRTGHPLGRQGRGAEADVRWGHYGMASLPPSLSDRPLEPEEEEEPEGGLSKSGSPSPEKPRGNA